MTMETEGVRKYKHKHPANDGGEKEICPMLFIAGKELGIEFEGKPDEYRKARKEVMSNELEIGLAIKAEDGNNPNKQENKGMEPGE